MARQNLKNNFLEKCPHCGSKQGFVRTFIVEGNVQEFSNFNGKQLDVERNISHTEDRFVNCIWCGGSIDGDKVYKQ